MLSSFNESFPVGPALLDQAVVDRRRRFVRCRLDHQPPLTRLGFGSTAVVTGDMTQVDLPKHVKSGLRDAIDVLRDVNGVSFTFFEARDVVRHPLVARIVDAYERRDAEQPSESR